jgi:hypothetical protein
MSESASSLVGKLLGQIRAETARLDARIPYAPEPLKTLARQIIDQQKSLMDPNLIDLIAMEDWAYSRPEDRLQVSSRRSEWIVWAKNQIEILRKLTGPLVYDLRDYAIMANNVFRQLCLTGGEWHDINGLAENVKAYSNTDDVAYIAVSVLVNMQYIEHDPKTNKVRLTQPGRENCDTDIEIPPSAIQELRRSLGTT